MRQLDRLLRQPAVRRLLGSTRARVVGRLGEGSVRAALRPLTAGLRGPGCVELIVGDGLYLTHDFCRSGRRAKAWHVNGI